MQNTFKETIKRVSFIKGITKYKAKKWLLENNILEGEDVELYMDGYNLKCKLCLIK